MSIAPKLQAKLQMRAEILKALAHPTRLFIIEELSKGERCVCELQQMVELDMSTVSKHLTVLKNVGLVSDDKRGNQVFYALEAPCVMNIFSCIEQAARANLSKRYQIVK